MALNNLTVYGQATRNGIVTSLGQADFETMVKRFIIWSRTEESRGTSSVSLQVSIRPIVASAAAPETREEQLMREWAQTAIPATELIVDSAKWDDPLYVAYMSMMNPRNVERETPETLMALRRHIEVNYPDQFAEQGHPF